ncbi:MAG: hypothetical protein MJ162_07760 [Treponema sp.]|nr:hypothetical protein [Treponema sp.]
MKKVVLISLCCLFLLGCSTKKQETAVVESVSETEIMVKPAENEYLFPEKIVNADALTQTVHINNYLHLLSLYDKQIHFIYKNGIEDDSGLIYYKENFGAGAYTHFVNNELLDDINVKTGSEKYEIERILGPASYLNKDYMCYEMSEVMEGEYRFSTEILFSLDKDYKVTKIRVYKETY